MTSYTPLDLLVDLVFVVGLIAALFLMICGATAILALWKRGRLFLLLLLLASSASAQTVPEQTGMSPAWAVSMFAAQAGDLITTEINHAHGLHESNVLMKSRYVRYPIKILGPIATYYAVKKLPRSQANRKAWGWTISGLGMTGVNVTLVKVWGK